MEYLVFEGKTYQEAFDQMYLVGSQKNILDRMSIVKKVEEERRGFLGFGKRKQCKVIVGVYEKRAKNAYKKASLQTPSLFVEKDTAPVSTKQKNGENIENNKLKAEVDDLKVSIGHLESLLKSQIVEIKESFIQSQIHSQVDHEKRLIEDVEISTKNIQWAEHFLREREFASFLIDDIVNHLKTQRKELLLEKPQILAEIREFLLKNIVSEEVSIDHYNYGNTILLAGPTGVGKTITIVKLAAHIAAMRQKTMRFISIDRYKVGADSQIKTYSGYLGASYYQIQKEDEFFSLIKKPESYFTFIDTAGKSPRETIAIQELGEWIKKAGKKIDVHLVVSATTKPADLDFIVDTYQTIGFSHIIATKLDETLYVGSILSILYKTGKPLSFVTNGQEVPEDFGVANIEKMISDSIK